MVGFIYVEIILDFLVGEPRYGRVVTANCTKLNLSIGAMGSLCQQPLTRREGRPSDCEPDQRENKN
jgi:hypothetical protein